MHVIQKDILRVKFTSLDIYGSDTKLKFRFGFNSLQKRYIMRDGLSKPYKERVILIHKLAI